MPACAATLASGPAASVLGSGTLDASGTAFDWTPKSDSKTRAIPFLSVERVQRTPREKPGCKVRIVLRGGGAYVFDIIGTDPHAAADAVVSVYTTAAASAVAPGSSAAAGGSSAPETATASSAPPAVSSSSSTRAATAEASKAKPSDAHTPAAAATGPSSSAAPTSSPTPTSSSRLSAFLRAVSGGSVFTDTDVASLKTRVLQGDPELASQYASVVGGGILADDEFWDAHLEALVDAATSKTKQALPSLMPDELQPDGAYVKLDRARKATIFLKEPAVHAALLV